MSRVKSLRIQGIQLRNPSFSVKFDYNKQRIECQAGRLFMLAAFIFCAESLI
jgi:hypothetical protein